MTDQPKGKATDVKFYPGLGFAPVIKQNATKQTPKPNADKGSKQG